MGWWNGGVKMARACFGYVSLTFYASIILEQERYRASIPLYLIRQKTARALDVHTRPSACIRLRKVTWCRNLHTQGTN